MHPSCLYLAYRVSDYRGDKKILSTTEARMFLIEDKVRLGIRDNVTLIIGENDELRKYDADGVCGSNNEGAVIVINRSDLTRFAIAHEMRHYHLERCLQRFSTIQEATRSIEDLHSIVERETAEILSKSATTALWHLVKLTPSIYLNLDRHYLGEIRANAYAKSTLKQR
ncbi:hypothetical protein HY637_01645 [Candidatus Woesearchaeota archaeon]|nr:hypothetical protein [Candidatus Woesearchaeota archaeon]